LLLTIEYWEGKRKKTQEKPRNVALFEQKAEKTKKKRKNVSFYCVFSVKVAHRIQKALSVLQLASFSGPRLGRVSG